MSTFTKSLQGRLAVYFALSIAVSLLVAAVISVGLVQRYLQHKTIAGLEQQAISLSDQIENEGLPLRRFFADLERVHDTRAFIVPSGEQQALRQRLAPRGEEVEPVPRNLPFIDWERLKRGETQVADTDLPGIDQKVIVVVKGFRSGGDLAGAIVLAKPVHSLQSWEPLAGWFLTAAGISLAASFLMSFLLARRLSRPLHEITQAATAMAEGDFSQEVTVRSPDEIGKLADAFRYLAAEVQKSQQQQREFVINVSHELKTPLTAISGHAQALREGVARDPDDIAKSLEVIGAETGRLSRLIEDLLSLAKFDARQFELKKTTVSLDDTLSAVADGFARQAQAKDIKFQTAAASGLKITTDPDRLRQILANLLQNALTHTPPGGEIKIQASARPSGAIIQVIDNGPGIAAQDLPRIFDRFYRADAATREAGLGLGLAISRELARALGGDITASSRPGRGSSFSVTLPA